MPLLHPETSPAAQGATVLSRWALLAHPRPDAPALTSPGASSTFAEADRDSDALAAGILALSPAAPGTVPGALGVLVEPDVAGITVLLAALKTGRPVVPLDPQLPAERLRQIAEQAALQTCVVADSLAVPGRALREEVQQVLQVGDVVRAGSAGAAAPGTAPAPGAGVVVFTSGSTGRPKGVVLTDGLLLAGADAALLRQRITDSDRFALVLPLAFAAGVLTLMTALLNGCGVWTYDPRARGVRGLADWIQESRLTLLHGTPHLVRSLVATLDADRVLAPLRAVVTAGEAVHGRDVVALRRHLPPDASFFNWLGSSEAGSVAQREWPAGATVPEGSLPAGAADPGKEVRVLRADGRDADVGEVGEVFVTSHDVAGGYWLEPGRSAEAFRLEVDGRRTYRMGDLGRIDAAGDLHVLGRVDGAVKVRGYLVALLEVEAALLTLPAVAEAAVLAVASPEGSARLVAYVSPRSDRLLESSAGVRRHLRSRLPEYMVPATIVTVREMPHNERGKIDRTALPDATTHRGGAPLTTPAERALAELWAQVLGLESIAADDDFLDLGGDSLDTEELLTLVEERFGVRLTSSDVLEASTLAEFARRVRPGTPSAAPHPTLVALRPEGSRTPLFCFAGGGALALSFLPISRHLQDRRVYAFQAAGFEQRSRPDWSVEAAARRHLRMIRALQPHGPYLLAGHSFGGLVALEVAHQLRAAGQEVGVVALLDTYLPRSGRPSAAGSPQVPASPGHRWRALLQRPLHRVLPDGLPPLHQVPERARVPLAGLVRFRGTRQAETMFNHAQVVSRRYRLKPSPGRTVAVIAHGNPDGVQGWEEHLAGSRDFLELPCDHNSLMREPFARDVAAWLGPELEEAER